SSNREFVVKREFGSCDRKRRRNSFLLVLLGLIGALLVFEDLLLVLMFLGVSLVIVWAYQRL
ncbi:MAG: hypothetical protein ABDH28_02780, partial [Brevinematia bacterium]